MFPWYYKNFRDQVLGPFPEELVSSEFDKKCLRECDQFGQPLIHYCKQHENHEELTCPKCIITLIEIIDLFENFDDLSMVKYIKSRYACIDGIHTTRDGFCGIR